MQPARSRVIRWTTLASLTGAAMACWGFTQSDAEAASGETRVASQEALPSTTAEAVAYEEAARAAWAYFTANRNARTGLVKATEGYANITTWDIASVLAGVHAAGELGLITRAESEQWLRTVLETLNRAPLYKGVALNKLYQSQDARMVGYGDRVDGVGNGWSALDLGRLMIWLRIIAQEHPSLAAQAESAVGRWDFSKLVADGYMRGETNGPRGASTYQEGKLGYEQYAAIGFALWGQPVPNALDLTLNAQPVEVLGHTLMDDTRGGAKLTSEPFIMMGMEVGWTGPFRDLAWRVLAVQEERFARTGIVTMLSEDALPDPPHYFYYYTIVDEGEEFAVRAHDPIAGTPPRWISSKAALAWHALLPNEYTWRVVRAVEPARGPRGWASGIYEGGTRSTDVRNLNTAGVILEASLYRQRGRPFLDRDLAMEVLR